MSKKDDALKLALPDRRIVTSAGNPEDYINSGWNECLDAIREALAEQPAQQEPVDVVWFEDNNGASRKSPKDCQSFGANGVPAAVWVNGVRYTSLQPAQQEPVSPKSLAQKAGINLPETYIPTMDDAIAAGDFVLMNEQAALLRECRAALDSLIAQKPTLAGLLCGSTTLGNLKAELGAYRPQGVFGTSQPAQRKPLTDEEIKLVMDGRGEEGDDDYVKPAFDPFGISEDDLMNFARAIEAAHGIKE